GHLWSYPSPTSTSHWLVLISHGTNAAQCLKFAVTEVRLEVFQGLIAESLAIDILDDGWRTLFCPTSEHFVFLGFGARPVFTARLRYRGLEMFLLLRG